MAWCQLDNKPFISSTNIDPKSMMPFYKVTVRDSLHKVIHFNTNDQFDVSGHEYFDA